MMNWYAIFAVNEKESIFVSILKFENSKNGSFPSNSSGVCDTFYIGWNDFFFLHYRGVCSYKRIGISYRPKIKGIIGKMNALLIKEQSNY